MQVAQLVGNREIIKGEENLNGYAGWNTHSNLRGLQNLLQTIPQVKTKGILHFQ